MIPSLLQIPSAVSDSKLHSVLPNNGKGDFTFDRSTGATRINRDGLIEEVGYFSSELVQNGNFSELGSDVVVNGNFDNGSTSWTLIGDVSIGNGVCTFFDTGSNTNSRLVQATITANKTYKVVFSVTRYVAGRVQLIFGGASAVNVNISAGVGTYTAYVTAGGSTTWEIKRDGGVPNFDFDIDNISVKQVDPNDRWTLGTGWSYGDSKAISDSTVAFQSLTQSSAISNSNGKTFKVKFTISDYQSGGVALYISGFINNSFFIFANGDYEYNLTVSSGTSGNVEFLTHSGGFKGVISNVSIVEVQGDRPRLSYDITNGVVEDKPHLLLEPSSTNLLTFSEDFNNGWSVNETTRVANAGVCPDGTNNAFNLIANAASGVHLLSATSSTTNQRTMSVFAKQNGYTRFRFNTGSSGNGFASFNLANGTVAATGGTFFNNAKIESLPNDWYRCSMTMNSGGGTTVTIAMEDDAGNVTFTGDVTNGILLWGGMLEEQSFATSYIPTAGTTITRAAETCNNSKPSVNSTEGVLYAEIKGDEDGGNRFIAVSNGDVTNCVRIIFLSNNIIGQVRAGGSEVFYIATSGISIEQYNKIAVSYKLNQCKLFVNGSQIGATDTSASMPTGLNTLEFAEGNGTDNFYGKVKGLAVYNEALSESQLMQLTGVTASSIYNNFVTRTASFTVEALNEVKKVIDNL